jgi:class 3 adenylate cyclase
VDLQTIKSLSRPDEILEFPGVRAELVQIGDLTVGRVTGQPGWRWSTHVRPIVGGEWCQARHIGYVVSGVLAIGRPDGSVTEHHPDDVFDVAPGHDGWVVGDEPAVQIEWAGIRAFAGFITGFHSRVLASLLFTDLVDSTAMASRYGDARWSDTLSQYYEGTRSWLERFGGREVKTTGDGTLARFESPVRAIRCAAAVRDVAAGLGLRVRAGVHVGEVELVGNDVRGVAVHEAARIMASAAPDEILVSDLTRVLSTGLTFEDRGVHRLKGLDGDWSLAAFVETMPASPVTLPGRREPV